MEDTPKVEMPRYRSHKVVQALKIKAIDFLGNITQGATITPCEEGFASFEADRAYLNKHDPEVGGYYVVYEDGYASWSPAKAFEEGYTRI